MYRTRRKYRIPIEELNEEYRDYVSKVVKTYSPASKKEYTFFRQNTKRKIDKELSYLDYYKIVKAIFQAVRELMLEYEGGVFLSRYGYFSLLIVPFQKGYKVSKYYYDNMSHTDGYRYVPILDTDVSSKSCIRKMIMDRTYEKPLRKKFWKAIEEGFRPKNYYTTLKSMYGRKNSKIQ